MTNRPATASLALSAPVVTVSTCGGFAIVFSSSRQERRFQEPLPGRGGGHRTPNLWFWRPALCQLSYAPVAFLARCSIRADRIKPRRVGLVLTPEFSRRRRRRRFCRLRGSQSAGPLPSRSG